MIRLTSIAAILATGFVLPASSANAATNLNARIQLITSALRNDAQFSSRDFSLHLKNGGRNVIAVQGMDGIRAFNDYAMLNSWLNNAGAKSVFQGGSYKFTHSVLGSFFDSPAPASAASEPAPNAPGSTPYKFTHTVLDSYFSPPEESAIMARSAQSEPLFQAMMAPPPAVPEPATWAMMIGGFAMAGGLLRARRTRLRTA